MGLVGNGILLTYLVSNVEAMTYWSSKIKCWKDECVQIIENENLQRMNEDMCVMEICDYD